MPIAATPTLLSLNRYARVMGLDPLHFAQGISVLRPEPPCSDVWYQYDWQDSDKVSRDQMARLIAEAERDIATALGYWPAPVWVEEERHPYPEPQRVDLTGTGIDARGHYKTVQTQWGWVRCGGKRATEPLGTADYTPLDADGDDYDEWAVFELEVSASLNTCEVNAYFKVYDGTDNSRTDPSSTGADPSWQVRPLYADLSDTTLTIRIPRWELFKPRLQTALGGVEPIDADDVANYVDELVFYRVYNDPQESVLFGWGDEYCETPACAIGTQTGCFHVRNRRSGLLIPQPATYADGEFSAASWAAGYEPNIVWLSYCAGLCERSIGGCDCLSDYWARTIAILATARLDWKLCSCVNVAKSVEIWREDLARNTDIRTFTVDPDVLSNPFGTRMGEVEAWKRVKGRGRRLGRAVKV